MDWTALTLLKTCGLPNVLKFERACEQARLERMIKPTTTAVKEYPKVSILHNVFLEKVNSCKTPIKQIQLLLRSFDLKSPLQKVFMGQTEDRIRALTYATMNYADKLKTPKEKKEFLESCIADGDTQSQGKKTASASTDGDTQSQGKETASASETTQIRTLLEEHCLPHGKRLLFFTHSIKANQLLKDKLLQVADTTAAMGTGLSLLSMNTNN